jgi:hypothetical protein
MQTNDELWKGALEDFPLEFIQKFYPDLYPHIDLNHPQPIEFLDKELAQLHGNSEIGQKRVDKLMGVHLRGMSQMKLLYIHVEVQGYNDDEFSKRNFIYYYRLFDLYGENITSLAIFTDDNPNYRPSVYELKFMGIELSFKYPIYKIMDENPETLEASDNLLDAAILTAYWAIQKKRGKLTEQGLADLRIDLMRRLFAKEVDKQRMRRLFDFIKQYVRFEKPEIAITFEQKFEDILNIEKNMGITEILIRQANDRVFEAEMNLVHGLEAAEKKAQIAQEIAQKAAQEAAQEATWKSTRKERKNTVSNMRKNKFSAKRIADILDYSIEEVEIFFKELDSEK